MQSTGLQATRKAKIVTGPLGLRPSIHLPNSKRPLVEQAVGEVFGPEQARLAAEDRAAEYRREPPSATRCVD